VRQKNWDFTKTAQQEYLLKQLKDKQLKKESVMEQNNGMTAEEVIFSNMTQIEALTRLLMKKGIITKDELQTESSKLMNESNQGAQ
jgi:hypothetical protein